MKKASIISIGNELLSGQTIDTNCAYLSDKLLGVGVPVESFYTVGDSVESIARSLKLASEDADLILVTGGLGPTDDDITRQGLAEFLGVDIEFHDELLERIKSYFASRNLDMSDTNKAQAYLPIGTVALPNNLGTAPGIKAKFEGRRIFVMPGVPSEMKAMFEESVLGELEKFSSSQAITVRKLKCFGAGESKIAEMLGSLMKRGRNPLINCTVHKGVITLHVIATADNKSKSEQMAEKDISMLKDKLGELVYGSGDETLAEVVGGLLVKQGKTIAVAESCTGGLTAKLLTDVSGSSRYFTYGWVTYSNEAKIKKLGVSKDLISKYGVVSKQVVEAMAVGAKKNAGTDYAIGITGIAGPSGGSNEKPIGLVHICIASDNNIQSGSFIFSHGREFIRYLTAQTAINMLRLELSD